MWRLLRIGILLYVLVFVAAGSWLAMRSATDWEDTLHVTVYPIAGDGSEAVAAYVDGLRTSDFDPVERFFEREVARYGVALPAPVRVQLAPPLAGGPPPIGASPDRLEIALWSLRLRWWAWRATSDDGLPAADVRIFVRYFAPDESVVLEPSVGLSKGMIGIVHAFASRRLRGSNHVVIAHELLHTLGASDKYDLATALPLYPDGYAEPARSPRHPQRKAEIMGGRIALSDSRAEIPASLREVLIGPATAAEIRLAP